MKWNTHKDSLYIQVRGKEGRLNKGDEERQSVYPHTQESFETRRK